MIRRRSTPWLHRYSRLIMGAVAVVGIFITTYLTYVSFSGGSAACPVDPATGSSSCDLVLQSSYAKVFGVPLSVFGLVAYIVMAALALAPFLVSGDANKKQRQKLEETTGFLLLVGGTAMAVFSGYLMYIAFFKLQETCLYCVASATCSLLLFILAVIGREWEELGQLLLTCIVVGMVTLIGAFGVYASADGPRVNADGKTPIPAITAQPRPPIGWPVSTTSGPGEIALAKHLTAQGIKMYGAFWCPHCFEQKQLFGKDAMEELVYIECDPSGKNPKTQACVDAKIQSFPSWEINGKIEPGVKLLDELAQISNFSGQKEFKYVLAR